MAYPDILTILDNFFSHVDRMTILYIRKILALDAVENHKHEITRLFSGGTLNYCAVSTVHMDGQTRLHSGSLRWY